MNRSLLFSALLLLVLAACSSNVSVGPQSSTSTGSGGRSSGGAGGASSATTSGSGSGVGSSGSGGAGVGSSGSGAGNGGAVDGGNGGNLDGGNSGNVDGGDMVCPDGGPQAPAVDKRCSADSDCTIEYVPDCCSTYALGVANASVAAYEQYVKQCDTHFVACPCLPGGGGTVTEDGVASSKSAPQVACRSGLCMTFGG